MSEPLPESKTNHVRAAAAQSHTVPSSRLESPPGARIERRSQARMPGVSEQALQTLMGILPGVRWLIGMLIACMVIAALYFGRELLIPLALAMLLGFLLDPAVTRLKRWGVPRMVATLLVVVVALGGMGGMGFYLGKQVQQLSSDLPTYQQTIQDKLRNLRHLATGPSVWDGALKTFDTVEREMKAAALEQEQADIQRVRIEREAPKPAEVVMQWLEKVSEPVAMAGIVLLFVILILLDRDDLRDRLLRLMGGNLHVATDALDEASDRIGKYLRMQFIVNVTYGIPMAAGLWFIGVPGAILWGVLATIMRFVPYVGPMISAVFPLALAFAVAPGWEMVLWTLGLILVLELISNNVIEPWLYGSSTGLSTLAIILAATFWTALWGPIGLILSTPLTVCFLVLGRYLPGLQFMEVLLGSQPVLDTPHRLYQRLLADDVDEAIDLATDSIEAQHGSKAKADDITAAVVHFYDTVALPTLQLAYKHHTEAATAEHRLRLSNGMEALVSELSEDYPAVHRDGQRAPRIHCVGARWEVDALAADMLCHSLQLHGLHATTASHALSATVDQTDTEGWGDVQWLVLSVFHAQPQALVKQVTRRLRRRYPKVHIVLALWNAPTALLEGDAAERLGVDAVGKSLQELVLRMGQLVAPEQVVQGYVPAALPDNDAARVHSLHSSGALSSAHLPLYKETALKAANAFDVKYAQVSLVDSDWVHTPGSLLVRSTADATTRDTGPGLPRDISMCSYVVLQGEHLVVEDVARDPRFASNPVLQEAHIKFYAGVPLKDKKGQVLGSLCIMHDAPHHIDDEALEVLEGMARELMDELRDSDAAHSA